MSKYNRPTGTKNFVTADQLIASGVTTAAKISIEQPKNSAVVESKVIVSDKAVITKKLTEDGKTVTKKKVHEQAKPASAPKRKYRSVNKLGTSEVNVDEVPDDRIICFKNLKFHYNLTERKEGKEVPCEDCDRSERKCSSLHYEQLERKGKHK